METTLFCIGIFCTLFGFSILISQRLKNTLNQFLPNWIIRLYLILCSLGKKRFIIPSFLLFISSLICVIAVSIAEDEFPVEAFAFSLWFALFFLVLLNFSVIFFLSKISIELGDRFVVKFSKNKDASEQLTTFFTLLGIIQILLGSLLKADTKYWNGSIHELLSTYINFNIIEFNEILNYLRELFQ